MKLFNLLLVWCSVCFVEVLSNNNSMEYELLYYYYVYKMEITSGVARTIATGCMPSPGNTMCFFDEFVKHIISDDWKKTYRPNPITDHTDTPDTSAIAKVLQNIPASAKYNLAALIPGITQTTKGTTEGTTEETTEIKSMPDVLSAILQSANDALEFGPVEDSDLDKAIAMCQGAKSTRAAAIFDEQVLALETEIPDAVNYITTFNSEFEWETMLLDIDNDVKSGNIEEEFGKELKSKIRKLFSNLRRRCGNYRCINRHTCHYHKGTRHYNR